MVLTLVNVLGSNRTLVPLLVRRRVLRLLVRILLMVLLVRSCLYMVNRRCLVVLRYMLVCRRRIRCLLFLLLLLLLLVCRLVLLKMKLPGGCHVDVMLVLRSRRLLLLVRLRCRSICLSLLLAVILKVLLNWRWIVLSLD